MKLINYALCCLVLLLSSSCAFSTSVVRLDYIPQDYGVHVQSSSSLFIEKLRDVRGYEPNLLSYKGVQYKTSGKYITEREVADIVTDAVRDVLKKVGYQIGGIDSDLKLMGEILKFESYAIVGFWSGDMECTIQVNLKLVDNKSGSILWSEIISGTGTKTGLQIDHEEHRKEVSEKAIDNLMTKIAQSTALRDAVTKGKQKPS